MKALLVTLLAGCAAGAPAQTKAIRAAAVPASHYAGIFENGRGWQYRVEMISRQYDEDSDESREETLVSAATCTAEVVKSSATEIVSRIRCAGDLTNAHIEATIPVCGEFLEGAWIANAQGLSRHVAAESRCFAPTGDAGSGTMISANPVPGGRVQEAPDGIGGRASIVERNGDVWCVKYVTWSGDESADTFCFSRDGIVAGAREFSGGQARQIRFCLQKRWCRTLPN